jgi:putative transcriptional regulator
MRTWLREARKENKLTMLVIANHLGISESYYCSIEAGTRQSSMDMALASKLSQILGISLKRIAELEFCSSVGAGVIEQQPDATTDVAAAAEANGPEASR